MDGTETLRRFNRTYTQRIGALDESFLGLGLPLGAARLVFEIGSPPSGTGGATVRELRDRLDLDSGYLSRLLRTLEERGLVEVRPDRSDRRRRWVTLTARGRSTRRRLDRRSEDLAETLLAPLTQRQRDRLVEALAAADLLVRAATVHLRDVDATSPTAVEAVEHYFAELDRRFPGGFDAAGARADDAVAMAPGRGSFVIATSDGRPVACGGVQTIDTAAYGPVAEIKRMWVHPDWRGGGLGSRMLRHLEAVCAGFGAALVAGIRAVRESEIERFDGVSPEDVAEASRWAH